MGGGVGTSKGASGGRIGMTQGGSGLRVRTGEGASGGGVGPVDASEGEVGIRGRFGR